MSFVNSFCGSITVVKKAINIMKRWRVDINRMVNSEVFAGKLAVVIPIGFCLQNFYSISEITAKIL
jgi:hypothetical protein